MNTPFNAIIDRIESVILGKRETTRLVLCSFLAGGHVLLEDRPGVGKSTLAKALAKCLGLEMSRIQMTSDLLPADVVGGIVYNRAEDRIVFRKGPVFSHMVFIDELNRASSRTQSALLEAMEERQVSADGETYPLPQPFFVLATQNPEEVEGTFGLPDSQLDRFLIKTGMGLPSRADEKELLKDPSLIQERLGKLEPLVTMSEIQDAIQKVNSVHAASEVLEYGLDLVSFTRSHFRLGLSPRASVNMLRAARACAWLAGRSFATPEDIRFVFPHVVAHRLRTSELAMLEPGPEEGRIGNWILEQVPVRRSA